MDEDQEDLEEDETEKDHKQVKSVQPTGRETQEVKKEQSKVILSVYHN